MSVNVSIPVHSDGYHWAFPSQQCLQIRIICSAGAYGYDITQEEPTEDRLPYDLLQRRDPIQWCQSFLLYEDNLHDFGYVVEECRVVGV